MLRRWLLGMFLLSTVIGSRAVTADANALDKIRQRAAAIRPTAEESRWTEIPWVCSVIEGQRLAREERRPIMYWHVDDDPLERC